MKIKSLWNGARSLAWPAILASLLYTLALPAADPVPAGNQGTVIVLPIREQIDQALIYVVRRAFREADSMPDLKAIVIDMDTPGGRVDLTEEIIDRIRAVKVPVYVYVNRKAQSAGAIIGLGCKAIFMAPNSRIGAAAPIMIDPQGQLQEMPARVEEKMTSDIRAMVRGLAEANGYLPDLAMAFVDQEIEVTIGERVVSPRGQLLVLTANEAVEVIPPRTEPLLARAVVDDLPALLKELNLENARVERIEITPSEQVAKWIIRLAPLLMIGFLLGAYIEMKTPGFGLPGSISIVCLCLLLFGHYAAGLAGHEEVALIVLGIALLIVEVFVIPGFGVVGLAGIGCILVGLFLIMIPALPDPADLPKLPGDIGPLANTEPYIKRALIYIMLMLCGATGGIWLLARILPRTGPYHRLVLDATQQGTVGLDMDTPRKLQGEIGVALTDLRPGGTARIKGKRLDVVTIGDYIQKGTRIRILRVNGPRIEVAPAPAEPETPTEEESSS